MVQHLLCTIMEGQQSTDNSTVESVKDEFVKDEFVKSTRATDGQ